MGFKIIWTKQAVNSLQANIDFLNDKWTEKEVYHLIEQVNKVLQTIRQHPRIFQRSVLQRHVHRAIIIPQISLVYQVKSRKKEIVLLNFWNNRRDPGRDKHK